MKELERRHPTQNIHFQGKVFQVCQSKIGWIILQFEQLKQGIQYRCEKQLQKLNFKTISIALHQLEQPTVTAQFKNHKDQEYSLKIIVNYQYLNVVEETFEFQAVRMSKERLAGIKQRQENKSKIAKIRKTIVDIMGTCSESGKVKKKADQLAEILLQIPFDKTVSTICLSFTKLASNTVIIKYYHFDTIIHKKIVTQILPEEGIYTANQTQLCLFNERSNFSKGVLTLEGSFESVEYLIKHESVKISQPFDKYKLIKSILLIGITLLVLYSTSNWNANILSQT